jgi:hypothetical protein
MHIFSIEKNETALFSWFYITFFNINKKGIYFIITLELVSNKLLFDEKQIIKCKSALQKYTNINKRIQGQIKTRILW